MKKLYFVLAGVILSLTTMGQAGSLQWEKSYGGSGADSARSVANTNDGGYYVAGVTYSTDGDVTGTHPNTGTYSDVWVIKINSSGGLVWEKTFGGSNQDQANSIYATSDGGAVIAGWTNSADGDVTSLHGAAGGAADFWVIKIDNTGTLQWEKTFGGTKNDYAQSIQQTQDGGYIVAGSTYSNDGDVTSNHDASGATADFWVVKLDASGTLTWQKNFGGSLEDDAAGVVQTSDGGYAVTGTSFSSDGDVSRNNFIGSNTSSIYLLLKLDNSGALTWASNFGGTLASVATSVVQTSDNGLVMSGYTFAHNGNVPSSPVYGGADNWPVKASSTGALDWGNLWGGSLNDFARSVKQTRDGSLIITGSTTSSNGLVNGQHGQSGTTEDVWTYELKASGYATWWTNCFGGTGNDAGFDVTETADSNFVEVGTSNSTDGNVTGNNGSYDFWIIKVQSKEGVASTSGISNITSGDNTLNIYPNPANDYATISVSVDLVGNWMELTDAVGRTISRGQIASSKFNIQTSGLARGMYFVKIIENNTSAAVKKLVVE